MRKLTRDPSVFWRVENRRVEEAIRLLAAETEGDHDAAASLGTVTILAGGVMTQLNLLGGEVWKLCDGTRGRQAVVAALLETFAADPAEMSADVDEFVDEMARRGLLKEE